MPSTVLRTELKSFSNIEDEDISHIEVKPKTDRSHIEVNFLSIEVNFGTNEVNLVATEDNAKSIFTLWSAQRHFVQANRQTLITEASWCLFLPHTDIQTDIRCDKHTEKQTRQPKSIKFGASTEDNAKSILQQKSQWHLGGAVTLFFHPRGKDGNKTAHHGSILLPNLKLACPSQYQMLSGLFFCLTQTFKQTYAATNIRRNRRNSHETLIIIFLYSLSTVIILYHHHLCDPVLQ